MNWFERYQCYERYSLELSREIYLFEKNASGSNRNESLIRLLINKIKEKSGVMKASVAAGLLAGALLSSPASDGFTQKIIDKLEFLSHDEGLTEEELISSMEDVQLDARTMDIPVGEPVPQPVQQPTDENEIDYRAYAEYIGQNEGVKPYVYDDKTGKRWTESQRGNPTIGIGHLMDNESREAFQDAFGYEVDFDAVMSGEQELTDPQIIDLFRHDVQERLQVTFNLFGKEKFLSYPVDVQTAILDGVYRGGLSGSPNTIALINSGDFIGASTEFLDNDEYRKSVKEGTGVAPRMRKISQKLLEYGLKLKKAKRQ